MYPKLKEAINIQDATENLEAITSIDLNALGSIGLWKKTRIVIDTQDNLKGAIDWIEEEEGVESLLEILDASFRAVHEYLIFLSSSQRVDGHSPKALGVIKNTVSLAANAAKKMERYIELKFGRIDSKINEREEFLEMSSYYQRNFSGEKNLSASENSGIKQDKKKTRSRSNFDAQIATDELTSSSHRPEYKAMFDFYQSQFNQEILHDERKTASEIALKDMSEVRMDKDYELFCIRHEDGMPFYDVDILSNMRLECNFDSHVEGFETDPLLQVRSILDRDAAAAASQIAEECKLQIKDFYKVFRKLVGNDLASCLGSMCVALFLSQNPRNLLQNSMGKTSIQYFEDFHQFLRQSYKTAEYQRLIAYPAEKSDKMAYTLLHLVHSFSKCFFLRISGVKQESLGLVTRASNEGSTFGLKEAKESNSSSFWAKILKEDEAYRSFLAKFPSGPLLKTLDLIRDDAEQSVPFDPISQGNYPYKLFDVGQGITRIDFIHLPCPTRQAVISKAEIVDELRGLFRSYLSSQPPLKHLLINLQDRTSWKETTRCYALEGLQKNAEFSKVFFVATIPKNTEFYLQEKIYETHSDAEEFMNFLLLQAEALEESGISLPTCFKPKEFGDFSHRITPFIHKNFFTKKMTLTKLEREDFIEIFDLFFSLKLIAQCQPASVSFTCKDAVDVGAAQTAAFYAFLKLLLSDFNSKNDHDAFRWLCYRSALLIRERAINPSCLHRIVSALQRIESALKINREMIAKEMEEFFNGEFLNTLKVNG